MARAIVPGSKMNEIAGSTDRFPDHKVEVWNPNEATIAEVATGAVDVAAVDISAFVESVSYVENSGFENADNPQMTRLGMNLRRNPQTGRNLRRGLVADGVIVRVWQGDIRVQKSDWVTIFTGIFRGTPGDNEGTRATLTEGITAIAFGREEQFLNEETTTAKYPTQEAIDAAEAAGDPFPFMDLGELAVVIASKHMGLGQDEILFGSSGFTSKHIVAQIGLLPALQGIYECMFPVGFKPRFDGFGRLTAIDTDLDKPAVRIYEGGNFLVKSRVAAPNEIDVNTRVIVKGLSKDKTKVGPDTEKMIVEVETTIGYFDWRYSETIWYSDDHTLTVDFTRLSNKTSHAFPQGTFWGNPTFDPDITGNDAFKNGTLRIETPFLYGLRLLLTATWVLAEGIAVAMQFAGADTGDVVWLEWKLLANAAMLLVIATMQYLGRFRVQVMGKPFEYVFLQLMSQAEVQGIAPENHRTAEFRNDFISDIATLDLRARDLLRREIAKDQIFSIELLDDPFLEVDDIIELAPDEGFTQGDRFYITSIEKTLRRGSEPTMRLRAWKISDGVLRETIEPLELAGGTV